VTKRIPDPSTKNPGDFFEKSQGFSWSCQKYFERGRCSEELGGRSEEWGGRSEEVGVRSGEVGVRR